MYKSILKGSSYDFLRSNPKLGSNIQLLALGGSHAYGMNKEGSDLDVRGIALNPVSDILLGKDFEQVCDTITDTVIYSTNKMLNLLSNCNPNTIEILGCKPEHYLYVGKVGQLILDNKKLFLSQVCINTFGGYANSQLRRLENKSAYNRCQTEFETHIMKSIKNARYSFKDKYYPLDNESFIELFIKESGREEFDSEIFMNINLRDYPLRDWLNMWNEMKSIVNGYSKIGKRNDKAIAHDKLGKHMAHLIRLFMMCIDILEKEEIVTYREKEHDLLMRIRNGEFLDSSNQPTEDFYDLLSYYEMRFDYAKKGTSLPELPNHRGIEELKMQINRGIVKGEF